MARGGLTATCYGYIYREASFSVGLDRGRFIWLGHGAGGHLYEEAQGAP